MTAVLALAAIPVVIILFGVGVHRLLRYGTDDKIDELIAANAAKSVPGYEAIDWATTNRAGQRRWQETLRAQRRPANAKPANAGKVYPMAVNR